jgi:hypothetical protein
MKKICICLDGMTADMLEDIQQYCKKNVSPHHRDAVTRSAIIRAAIECFYDNSREWWTLDLDEVLDRRWR